METSTKILLGSLAALAGLSIYAKASQGSYNPLSLLGVPPFRVLSPALPAGPPVITTGDVVTVALTQVNPSPSFSDSLLDKPSPSSPDQLGPEMTVADTQVLFGLMGDFVAGKAPLVKFTVTKTGLTSHGAPVSIGVLTLPALQTRQTLSFLDSSVLHIERNGASLS